VLGENGMGKTHLLKIMYGIMEGVSGFETAHVISDEQTLKVINNNLCDIFQIQSLSELCRLGNPGANAYIMCQLADSHNITVNISQSKDNTLLPLTIEGCFSSRNLKIPSPIFIPAKETLSATSESAILYEEYKLGLDRTYYTLSKAISRPSSKQLGGAKEIIVVLEEIIGGRMFLQEGLPSFRFPGQDTLRTIDTLSEGYRKIALLAHLIANKSLKPGTTLFWDDTETSLGPKLMKDLAIALVLLAQYGIQIILSTHSFFLMKELSLQGSQDNPLHYFNIVKDSSGVIVVEQGGNLTELGKVSSVDETLSQYDREYASYY
jgi:energy-coupling factor transporter ATP-binding protein EcfA2